MTRPIQSFEIVQMRGALCHARIMVDPHDFAVVEARDTHLRLLHHTNLMACGATVRTAPWWTFMPLASWNGLNKLTTVSCEKCWDYVLSEIIPEMEIGYDGNFIAWWTAHKTREDV